MLVVVVVVGAKVVQVVVDVVVVGTKVARRDLDNPFTYFDSIFCITLDRELERWKAMRDRFGELGIAWRVERFSALEIPANDSLDTWMARHASIGQYVQSRIADGTLRGFIGEAPVVSRAPLRQYEDGDSSLAPHSDP